jgi:SPP1 gp7 family putative phage head morphogenesis protein
MVEEIIDTSEPGILENLKDNLLFERNPSSLLSLLSSVTAAQSRILNYIFTSEMMALENTIRGDEQSPIMDVYNAVWLIANLNMFAKEKYSDKMVMYNNNTTRAALNGINYFHDTTKMPFNNKQQVVSLINDNSMKYITKLGDDIKGEMSKVLKDAVIKGETANDTVTKLKGVMNSNSARARTIVRTETMRAANSAGYAQALSEGKRYYIVDSRAEACRICKKKFTGEVFDITNSDPMPPLHPNCACVPMFFDDLEDANRWATKISNDIDKQVKQLEDKGLTIKPDGTGAEVNKIPADKRVKN